MSYTHLFQEIIPDNCHSLEWPSGSPTSSAIDLRPHGGRAASVLLFSGWTSSMIGIEASIDNGSGEPLGFGLLRNSGGAPVGITGVIAGNMTGMYEAPPEWYMALGYPFVRLASVSGTGSAIPQSTARVVKMMLIKA